MEIQDTEKQSLTLRPPLEGTSSRHTPSTGEGGGCSGGLQGGTRSVGHGGSGDSGGHGGSGDSVDHGGSGDSGSHGGSGDSVDHGGSGDSVDHDGSGNSGSHGGSAFNPPTAGALLPPRKEIPWGKLGLYPAGMYEEWALGGTLEVRALGVLGQRGL